jgi:hypothetical protein
MYDASPIPTTGKGGAARASESQVSSKQAIMTASTLFEAEEIRAKKRLLRQQRRLRLFESMEGPSCWS